MRLPSRGQKFPRIEQSVRVQCLLDLLHQRIARLVELSGEEGLFREAHAVFTRDRPSQCDRLREDLPRARWTRSISSWSVSSVRMVGWTFPSPK